MGEWRDDEKARAFIEASKGAPDPRIADLESSLASTTRLLAGSHSRAADLEAEVEKLRKSLDVEGDYSMRCDVQVKELRAEVERLREALEAVIWADDEIQARRLARAALVSLEGAPRSLHGFDKLVEDAEPDTEDFGASLEGEHPE